MSDPTYGDYYVTTVGPGGTFTINSDYTCTGGQQVYLYSVGGDPGLGTGTNSAAGLLAALGTCPGTTGATGQFFSSTLNVVMNEVSTVAAACACGYATDAVHVSSSGTAAAKLGLADAFINAEILQTSGVANPYPLQESGITAGQARFPRLRSIRCEISGRLRKFKWDNFGVHHAVCECGEWRRRDPTDGYGDGRDQYRA